MRTPCSAARAASAEAAVRAGSSTHSDIPPAGRSTRHCGRSPRSRRAARRGARPGARGGPAGTSSSRSSASTASSWSSTGLPTSWLPRASASARTYSRSARTQPVRRPPQTDLESAPTASTPRPVAGGERRRALAAVDRQLGEALVADQRDARRPRLAGRGGAHRGRDAHARRVLEVRDQVAEPRPRVAQRRPQEREVPAVGADRDARPARSRARARRPARPDRSASRPARGRRGARTCAARGPRRAARPG